MSLDIDWSLLQPLLSPSSTLLETLNVHLQSTSRPSFIGPIQITSLDFGTVSPEVTLKDIRDVWRAFDEGDDEGDEETYRLLQAQEVEKRRKERAGRQVMSTLDDEAYDMVLSPMTGQFGDAPGDYHPSAHGMEDDEALETGSVYSGWSARPSVAAVGIGAGSIAIGGLGSGSGHSRVGSQVNGGVYGHRPHPSLGGRDRPGGHERHQSYYTAPYPPSHLYPSPSVAGHAQGRGHGHGHGHDPFPQYPSPSAGTRHRQSPSPTPPITSSTPPPSPPARPGHLPDPPSAGHGIPSVQLHLSVSHTSDLSITLLTSLQVNYPSPLFMSLPLKLSITGLRLAADVIIAYSGAKHRLHLTIVPPTEEAGASPERDHRRGAEEIPIGQKLLPHISIESEIGHADVHVLRNVGKVERFIADAVRKTLVEELVFPNFHTVAL